MEEKETLNRSLNDLTEIGEINTRDLIEFKEISHMIEEAFEKLEARIVALEEQAVKKGFNQLSLDIEKIIRRYSDSISNKNE